MTVAKFDSVEGTSVLVEIDDDNLGLERVSRGSDGMLVAGERIEDALARVRPAAQAVLEVMKGLAPDKVTVEFGIKLNAQAGAMIAKTGAEGHFVVTLEWAAAPRDSSCSSEQDQ